GRAGCAHVRRIRARDRPRIGPPPTPDSRAPGSGAAGRPAEQSLGPRSADHQRPAPDAGGRDRHARERDRVRLRDQATIVRGRVEAVFRERGKGERGKVKPSPLPASLFPVSEKPNPGPKTPRVGGRAKWPSHSDRGLYQRQFPTVSTFSTFEALSVFRGRWHEPLDGS